MSNKNSENCKLNTDDDTLEACPECDMEPSVEMDENVAEYDDHSDEENLSENINDEEESVASKKVKIITASVAFVLVLFIGFFAWYMYGKGNPPAHEKFDVSKMNGEYMAHDGVEYFKFETKETKVEISSDNGYMEEMFEDMVALSDGVISSDASQDPAEKEYATFDGTYESGPTDKSVRDMMIIQYINTKGLMEEYRKYVEENNLYMDDFEGFAKEKEIPQAELDKLNEEYGFDKQREFYITKGYWKYNEQTGVVDLYDESGINVISSFAVSGNDIVETTSFLKGKNHNKEKFETTYTCSFGGYSTVMSFYKDGNCIVKSTYQGNTEYLAGTYTSNKEFIKITLGQQSQSYVKVKDGIAPVAYIKQK